MKGTLHWTAGSYTPSDYERQHYHILIGYDSQAKKAYPEKCHNYTVKLRHTWNRNEGNVAISICAMAGAQVGYNNFGPYPVTEAQIDEACKCAAEICKLKGMKPDNWKTHAEYALLDKYGPFSNDQQTRWDLAILRPVIVWDKKRACEDVKCTGDLLRAKIKRYFDVIDKPRAFHYENIEE